MTKEKVKRKNGNSVSVDTTTANSMYLAEKTVERKTSKKKAKKSTKTSQTIICNTYINQVDEDYLAEYRGANHTTDYSTWKEGISWFFVCALMSSIVLLPYGFLTRGILLFCLFGLIGIIGITFLAIKLIFIFFSLIMVCSFIIYFFFDATSLNVTDEVGRRNTMIDRRKKALACSVFIWCCTLIWSYLCQMSFGIKQGVAFLTLDLSIKLIVILLILVPASWKKQFSRFSAIRSTLLENFELFIVLVLMMMILPVTAYLISRLLHINFYFLYEVLSLFFLLYWTYVFYEKSKRKKKKTKRKKRKKVQKKAKNVSVC